MHEPKGDEPLRREPWYLCTSSVWHYGWLSHQCMLSPFVNVGHHVWHHDVLHTMICRACMTRLYDKRSCVLMWHVGSFSLPLGVCSYP